MIFIGYMNESENLLWIATKAMKQQQRPAVKTLA